MNDVLESIIAQSDLASEVEDFLSHHGVKGQHWGIRNKRQKQAHLDRVSRIANGTATRNERGMVRRRSGTITKKSARRELRRAEKSKSLVTVLKARNNAIKVGALSKDAAHKGTVRFGRNLVLASLAGGAAGFTVGKIASKHLY